MASGRPFQHVDRAVLSRRMEGRVRSVWREHGGNRQATYDTDYIPPWSHLSAGLFVKFLQRERRFAQQEKTTPDCTYDTCSACGVCMGLNTAIQTQEVRHG